MALAQLRAPSLAPRPVTRRTPRVVCQAATEARRSVDAQAVALVAGALVATGFAAQLAAPEAAVAARSGGRASSTMGFAARRSAMGSRAAPGRCATLGAPRAALRCFHRAARHLQPAAAACDPRHRPSAQQQQQRRRLLSPPARQPLHAPRSRARRAQRPLQQLHAAAATTCRPENAATLGPS